MPSTLPPSTSTGREQPSKVIRAPNLKRGKIEESIGDRIKLERVLGVTVTSNAALASGPDGTIAYPAGCTVVLFNPRTERQTHLVSAARKTITSVAFSSCGRYVATGECGHQPALRVWDLYPDTGAGPQTQQVCQSLDHKFGISCIAFSPSVKYVVSIGTQHDMIVNVWDWRNNVRIASNKVSNKVKALSFAENGNYFVTVGNRHVKFWYLESGKFKRKEAVPLMGRSAILGDLRDNYFCDVACGRGECGDYTYAITKSGFLCQFNNRRLLDKWVELRTTSANCITVGSKYIFVGCAESIVRCFDPATLKFVTTLPRTHYLGVDVSMGVNISHMSSPPRDAKYPDTVAITFNETTNKVTSIYNDHSVYIWDVCHIERVGKSHSFLYHSACIWGVEVAPPNSPLPPGSFVTCSSDDTIRVWTLDRLNDGNDERGMYRQNVYSNDLVKVVYVDDKLGYIKDVDLVGNNDKQHQTETSYDGRHGVRSIRISPDGRNLAAGDRSGNISVFVTRTMERLCKIEAHDAEVLCLEYFGTENDVAFLASASRDRLLHVFDVKHGYDFLQTLDDHSSSITAVRFVTNQSSVQMVSCGADKSLIFRTLGEVNNRLQFNRVHHASVKTTLYDMEVDAGHKHVLAACQDRNVRIYNANSGKHTKNMKGSCGEDGTLIKVALDRSGIYLATSCTDKSLNVFDYYSGECMATMCGHSELATGLRFTNDCTRLISASGDGCIFVWRVPHDMVVTMQARLSQQAIRLGKSCEIAQSAVPKTTVTKDNYRFSVGKLPQWAQKQLTDEPGSPLSSPVTTGNPTATNKNVCPPRGKWMVRTSTGGLNFDSVTSGGERKFDSDGSKDSSLEETRANKEISGKDISVSTTMTREVGYATTDTGFESAAHDGDIDSDNDYRHRPLYYPCQVDSASGSEFTVTNIDEDELRKSVRKKKDPPKIVLQKGAVAPSSPSHYDSDYEDEMQLTPTDDRSPSSLLYVSTESLDQLVTRERYLQSAFDNLSGTESGGRSGNVSSTAVNNASFSSKFLARNSDVNAAAINAVNMTRNNPEAIKKRELLNKRIADAKKKLDSVGHSLKFSQSTHDLSRAVMGAEINRSSSSVKKQGTLCTADRDDSARSPTDFNEPVRLSPSPSITNTGSFVIINPNNDNYDDDDTALPRHASSSSSSSSVPKDLQLCGCYLRDIVKNTSHISNLFDSDLIAPRKLKLDKTLAKYKHKSLPVSPVSEERSFLDFASNERDNGNEGGVRKSFSYFVDLRDQAENTDADFRQVCDDIEQFSRDFNKKYELISSNSNVEDDKDDDGNFSSDSLEEYSFRSVGSKSRPPRRCVSNNELFSLREIKPKMQASQSESFFLNQNRKSDSQESILSSGDDILLDDYYESGTKSYCNSMESVLSNESDCKSAPLEVLFAPQKSRMAHSYSLPKNFGDFVIKTSETKKTIETQTDFDFQGDTVKKPNLSEDFKKRLMKFESKKPVAFFVPSKKVPKTVKNSGDMTIPTLHDKNRQYKSRYCNVLNNKPELSYLDIFEQKGVAITGTNLKFEKNTNKKVQETSSLDRHLFAKGLFLNEISEKVCHKPPKAVRRHSSKSRKTKTSYEYVKKEDFYNNRKRDNRDENNTIEISYKEKNCERDLQGTSPNILNELYDSLDKSLLVTKQDVDSLEVNLSPPEGFNEKSSDVNVWVATGSDKFVTKTTNAGGGGDIQSALENLKILNKIQRKIVKINVLIDVFKKNVCEGKVRALSCMYENMSTKSQSYYNDLTRLQATPIRFRRRNLSLPCFVERRLNHETANNRTDEAYSNQSNARSNRLRRSCSLSDLSIINSPTNATQNVKSKPDNVTGRKSSGPSMSSRSTSRYAKNTNGGSMARSRSTSVLNKADSDDDDATSGKNVNRLMRPTISSHNKVNKPLPARRKLSHSTNNLNALEMENVSTSEDDLPLSGTNNKSVVMTTASRETSAPVVTPRRHFNGKGKVKASPRQRHLVDDSEDSDLDGTLVIQNGGHQNNSDLSTVELERQAFKDAITELNRVTDKIATLYSGYSQDGGGSSSGGGHSVTDRNDFEELELLIFRSQKFVHELILMRWKEANGNLDLNTDAMKKLMNDLASNKRLTGNGNESMMQIMEEFTEILSEMMQLQMRKGTAST